MQKAAQNISTLPFHKARELILKKEISIKDLVKDHIQQIESLNPSLQAYTYIAKDLAFQRAEILSYSLEKSPESIDSLPLLGLTLSISDFLLEYEDTPMTNGSLSLDRFISKQNSYIINRCLSLGAIILGKTHVSEFYTSDLSISPTCGPCRNPLDDQLLAGGPAGGGAAACAANLCNASIGVNLRGGTDLPANHCGLYSLCLSRGKTPMSDLIDYLLKPHLHYGITARDPLDLAMITDALAIADSVDPDTYPNSLYSHTDYVKGESAFSIGWMPQVLNRSVHENCESTYSSFFKSLEEKGHKVERAFFQELGDCHGHARDLLASLISTCMLNAPQQNPDLLEESTSTWASCCENVSSGHYFFAKAALSMIKQELYLLLNQYDMIATPVSPLECIHLDEDLGSFDPVTGLLSFIWPFSLSGISRLIIPCGKSKNGYPVGIQVLAREKEEGLLLRFAKQVQTVGEP